MRQRAVLLMLLVAAVIGGCGATQTVVVEVTPGEAVNITVRPAPGAAANAGAEAPQTIDVISERLRLLGAGSFSIEGGGESITASLGSQVDRFAAEQAVRSPGVLQFAIHLDASASPPANGDRVDGPVPLWEDDQVDAVSSGLDSGGLATVSVQLSAAGTDALDTFTAGHAGELLVMALDHRVLATVAIEAPANGPTTLTFAAPRFVSLAVLTAILESGPLPKAWRQQ